MCGGGGGGLLLATVTDVGVSQTSGSFESAACCSVWRGGCGEELTGRGAVMSLKLQTVTWRGDVRGGSGAGGVGWTEEPRCLIKEVISEFSFN